MRNSDANRKLMFEGTVEVDGTFTGQMLHGSIDNSGKGVFGKAGQKAFADRGAELVVQGHEF